MSHKSNPGYKTTRKHSRGPATEPRRDWHRQGHAATCGRCGRSHKPDDGCPSRDRTCRKCNKIGHFKQMCRTRNVKEVTSTKPQRNKHNYFLGSVTKGQKEEPWCVSLQIGASSLSFNSGAVTTLDYKTYKSMVNPPDMRPTSDTLAGAGGEITCYRKFQTITRSKDREHVIDVYVIDGSNLLGREASALGFSKFNRDQRAIAELTIDSDVFGDTRLMKTSPLNIKINEGATLYHVNVARRVPIPLLPKVEDELRRLERAGIIKKIPEPTPWCAPMVDAPKKPDKARICIDVKQLNKVAQIYIYIYIERERDR